MSDATLLSDALAGAASTRDVRRRVVTPLGVRFLDHATGLPITSGLTALALPASAAAAPGAPTVRGVANPSGVIGFHGLPGLRAYEHPEHAPPEDADLPSVPSPPRASPFLVMVADEERRFLPAVFVVDVPFTPAPASIPEGHPPLPVLDAMLFSAPTRTVIPGLGAVRADLWDADTREPAAHAVVRVAVADRSGIGVADARGQVLVLFPLPIAERLRLGSPPGSARTPGRQTWAATVEVYSTRDLPLPAGSLRLPAPWTGLPGVKAVLTGQARAVIWPSTSATEPMDAWSGELGTTLILRTTPASRLWISRGASPP